MKKVFALLFGLFAASQVFAASFQVCTDGAPAVLLGAAGAFVVQDVAIKCSANVNAKTDQNAAIGFAVASSSVKGKNIFTGNTGGGSVTSAAACTPLPCTAGQLDAPLATAVALAT